MIIIMHTVLFFSVMMPDRYCCQTPGDRVTLTGNRGMIANYVTQSSGCGGIDCPWFLEASPGQIFNISLFDFSTFKRVSVFPANND